MFELGERMFELSDENAKLKKENELLKNALHEIANCEDIHTRLNQERLCCKFQDIASEALK